MRSLLDDYLDKNTYYDIILLIGLLLKKKL